MLKKLTSIIAAMSMTAALIPSAALAANGDTIEKRTNDVDIRIGVFGDTHVTAFPVANEDWTSAERAIAPIMRYYKTMAEDIDAFAMPGDVIYNVEPKSEKTPNDEDKYKAVLDKMSEFFTIDTTTDAVADTDEAEVTSSKVIWSMGNHEITQGAYSTANVQFDENRTWEQEVSDNKARYTAALGHEPCYTTTVNGYTFVTSEPYSYLNDYVNPTDKSVMSDAEKKAKGYLETALADGTNKPVFYLQHEAIDKTFFGSSSTIPTRNSAEFREFILNNPRIITISGHTHFPAQDPRCIYQTEDGSTHINIPVTMGGNMSGYSAYDDEDFSKNSSHGILLEVVDDVVTVLRFDVTSGKYIGEPYVFTAGTAEACYTDTRYDTAKASEVNVPYFEGEASVSEITNNTAKLNFPIAKKDGESAEGLQDSFVHFYNVKVTNTKTGNVVATKRLLEDFWRQDDVKRTSRNVYLENLSRNTTYEVSIVAASSLGQESEALTTAFTTTNEKTAEDLALTKKIENKNVALGKTVTLSTDGTTVPKLTDGNEEQFFSATLNNGEGVVLDLGRRYNIDEIVINSYDGGQAERGFVLYGSNDPTFPADNRTKLYEFGVSQNTNPDFDDNNNLSVVPTTEADFRYLKYERTIDGWYIYLGEISVYADEYETEVSRNKPVEAVIAPYSNNPIKYIVDGDTSTAWWSAYSGAGNGKETTFGTQYIYDYITIDLEESLPVSRIEIVAEDGAADATRIGASIFGSNELSETGVASLDETVIYRPKMAETASMPDIFTELATTGANDRVPAYGETPLPMAGNGVDAVGYIDQAVNAEQNAYRFITYKRLQHHISQIAEIRAFVTNPTLNSVASDNGSIVLSFSDPMNADTLNNNSIKVYDINEEIIADAVVTPSADGYSATITNVADAFKVQITYDVLGASGAEIAGKMEYYIASAADLSGKPIITEENVNVAQGKTITVENAELTTGSTSYAPIVDGNEATQTFMYSNKSDGESNTNPSYITLDLENRYNIKKIDLLMYDNDMNNFAIYVSNDENFKTYDTLIDYNGYGGDQFDENHRLVLELDGTLDYRYVRIYRKGYAWFGIKELAVYADTALAEVSRDANVTVSNSYNTTQIGSKIVDGKNAQNSDGWLSGWNGAIEWATVDLGTTLPVVRIEMESPFDGKGGGDYNNRRAWTAYGSNISDMADQMSNLTTSGGITYLASTDYTKLGSVEYGWIPSYNSGSFDEQVYYTFAESKNNWATSAANNPHNGILRDAVSGNYRYISFLHGLAGMAALGEVRVYSPAPTANSVRVDGSNVTVSFSDKMFPDSMNEDTIVLKNAETGEVIAQSNTVAKGYEYTFEADLDLNTSYVIEVADTVKNLNNLTVSETRILFTTPDKLELTDVRVDITNGKFVSTLAASTAYTLSGHISSEIAEQKTVTILAVEKTGERVVAVHSVEKTAYANTDSYFTLKFTTGETVGEDLEIYLLDGFGTMTPYGEKTTY